MVGWWPPLRLLSASASCVVVVRYRVASLPSSSWAFFWGAWLSAGPPRGVVVVVSPALHPHFFSLVHHGTSWIFNEVHIRTFVISYNTESQSTVLFAGLSRTCHIGLFCQGTLTDAFVSCWNCSMVPQYKSICSVVRMCVAPDARANFACNKT